MKMALKNLWWLWQLTVQYGRKGLFANLGLQAVDLCLTAALGFLVLVAMTTMNGNPPVWFAQKIPINWQFGVLVLAGIAIIVGIVAARWLRDVLIHHTATQVEQNLVVKLGDRLTKAAKGDADEIGIFSSRESFARAIQTDVRFAALAIRQIIRLPFEMLAALAALIVIIWLLPIAGPAISLTALTFAPFILRLQRRANEISVIFEKAGMAMASRKRKFIQSVSTAKQTFSTIETAASALGENTPVAKAIELYEERFRLLSASTALVGLAGVLGLMAVLVPAGLQFSQGAISSATLVILFIALRYLGAAAQRIIPAFTIMGRYRQQIIRLREAVENSSSVIASNNEGMTPVLDGVPKPENSRPIVVLGPLDLDEFQAHSLARAVFGADENLGVDIVSAADDENAANSRLFLELSILVGRRADEAKRFLNNMDVQESEKLFRVGYRPRENAFEDLRWGALALASVSSKPFLLLDAKLLHDLDKERQKSVLEVFENRKVIVYSKRIAHRGLWLSTFPILLFNGKSVFDVLTNAELKNQRLEIGERVMKSMRNQNSGLNADVSIELNE